MNAQLILENGRIFEGKSFGAPPDALGEVVFTTAMTGYQEILTDPSFAGQMVVMTYPLIGNYGMNLDDAESSGPKCAALIVREVSTHPNNFRCEFNLSDALASSGIPGLCGIDTRALTKILRTNGPLRGRLVAKDSKESLTNIEKSLTSWQNENPCALVSCPMAYRYSEGAVRVAVLDYGIKANILRTFAQKGCQITVYPYDTPAQKILSLAPDLVFLSNGPGDPQKMEGPIAQIRSLIGQVPIAGICLGHQLLALALGGETARLPFGHRGANHPVADLESGRVRITSQNHGYYVSRLPEGMRATHRSLNDSTLEGMRHKTLPLFTVQFHPEACPGPLENLDLFDAFIALAKEKPHAEK
ncbi:Carbamoyl-phosphate synthase small chain [Clostridiaceae bacterium JG1575]|nr:Carbamoyl-phosphate synthase small chain [Clostridiaceae bacterium JG1575]